MCSFPISKQTKLKVCTSINKRSALCLYCDEVSAILQALHIRALLSRSSGKAKFDSNSRYVKAGLLRFCRDHFRFLFVCLFVCLFCKLHSLHLGSRGPSAKYLRWNKQVDIKSSFSSAHRVSLTRLHREPSESIRIKISSGIQGKHFVKLWAHSPRPTSKII